jgi:hypothetical protein
VGRFTKDGLDWAVALHHQDGQDVSQLPTGQMNSAMRSSDLGKKRLKEDGIGD